MRAHRVNMPPGRFMIMASGVFLHPLLPIFSTTIASTMECYPFSCRVRRVEQLFQEVRATEGYELTVDLPNQLIIKPDGFQDSF